MPGVVVLGALRDDVGFGVDAFLGHDVDERQPRVQVEPFEQGVGLGGFEDERPRRFVFRDGRDR